MTEENPLNIYRNELSMLLGKSQIQSLHLENKFFDWSLIISSILLFSIFIWLLATLDFGITWLIIFFLQGALLQIFGLMAHDLCTHRKIGGEIISYILDLFFCSLTFRKPSVYRRNHMRHHRYVNSNKDPEITAMIQAKINNKLIRFFLLTIFGQMLLQITIQQGIDNQVAKKSKIKFEFYFQIIYIVALIILLCIWTKLVFWGYILPFLIIVPILSMFRLILEHMDVDPKNPIQAVTFYKTNAFTKALFFFGSGDCHLIHHIFPLIPFYNIPRAIKLFRPYLLEKEIREHLSFLRLLNLFFIKNAPIRSPWDNRV